MPTKPREIYPNNIYHAYNRATEKRTIFYTEKDYNYFLEKIFYYQEKTKIKILAYAIMPNHWHFMLQEPENLTRRVDIHPPGEQSEISKFISLISNSYTKYFNYTKEHSGRIFQGPFKSKLVKDEGYFHTLVGYINLNPLKHKIIKNINDWPYTSHHDYFYKSQFKLIKEETLINFREYQDDLKIYLEKIKEIKNEFDPPGEL